MRTYLILILITPWIFYSQEKYPKNYFVKPIDIPIALSGSFGELRSNHFHSGIDIKTQFKEGFNILSSADGFISRIKIAHGGFGKAIYVDHRNGFTTVYAHLKNFSEKIEKYVKEIQYKRQSFELDLYLPKNKILVSKNEIIAFSGNTGSSAGPHLHYEIRKTSNQKPLNPLLFGINVKDSKRPEIRNLYHYNNINSNFSNLKPLKLSLKKVNDSLYRTNETNVNGFTGFGISVFDRQDLANNKNGVYKISTYYNNELINSINYDAFFFEESILINTLIDYKYYINNKERIIKLFKTPGNTLNIYKNRNDGLINKVMGNSTFKIIISDIKNNKLYVEIPIDSRKNIKTDDKKLKSEFTFNRKINNSLEYNFNIENHKINISKNTFLKDVNLFLNKQGDSLKILNPDLPVFKNIRITFPNSNNLKGNYLVNIDHNKNESFISSNLDSKNNFVARTKKLGTFYIKNDSIPPSIKSLSFKNNDWISNKNIIRFSIQDKESGIKKYRGTINGKWVLFEYEYKSNQIHYQFDDFYIRSSKNDVEIIVEDMVGNITKLNSTFYKKTN
jgi:hypothetical protein